MRHILKLTICTAILVNFFCQFAAAQNSFLPDNNLRRYQSLKYMLIVQEDIESFGGKKVTDESVQEKIDDFFDANHLPCTRQTSASPLPCLIIKVVPQVGVGPIMRPTQICRVYFYVVDQFSGTNAEVWEDDVEGYFTGGGLANICQTYWDLIDEKLNNFRSAWFSTTHSQQGSANSGNAQNKDSHNPQPATSEQTKVETARYTLDKSGSDWKVVFKSDDKIDHHLADGRDVFIGDVNAADALTLKPGEWVEHQPEPGILGRGPWSVLRGLDRRTSPDAPQKILAQEMAEDNKTPGYTIDKTIKPDEWIIVFDREMYIRREPLGREHIEEKGRRDGIKPGEYFEKQNLDGSWTLLKDLDRRADK